jgi:hypothetical protein
MLAFVNPHADRTVFVVNEWLISDRDKTKKSHAVIPSRPLLSANGSGVDLGQESTSLRPTRLRQADRPLYAKHRGVFASVENWGMTSVASFGLLKRASSGHHVHITGRPAARFAQKYSFRPLVEYVRATSS